MGTTFQRILFSSLGSIGLALAVECAGVKILQ